MQLPSPLQLCRTASKLCKNRRMQTLLLDFRFAAVLAHPLCLRSTRARVALTPCFLGVAIHVRRKMRPPACAYHSRKPRIHLPLIRATPGAHFANCLTAWGFSRRCPRPHSQAMNAMPAPSRCLTKKYPIALGAAEGPQTERQLHFDWLPAYAHEPPSPHEQEQAGICLRPGRVTPCRTARFAASGKVTT